jgi:hypothetical protein
MDRQAKSVGFMFVYIPTYLALTTIDYRLLTIDGLLSKQINRSIRLVLAFKIYAITLTFQRSVSESLLNGATYLAPLHR